MNFFVKALSALMLFSAVSAAAQMPGGNSGEMFLQHLKDGKDNEAVSAAKEAAFSYVNYRGMDGDAAIHIVTRRREGNWISYLIANGADPNTAGKDGDTALIIAARLGFTEGVTRLLDRKAQVDKINRRGESALIVAVQTRRPDIVRQLLEAGADPDRRDYGAGYSARDYAKRDSRMPDLLKLIESVKSKKAIVSGPTKKW